MTPTTMFDPRLKQDRQALVDVLEQAGAEVNGNKVKCPFHPDRNPSAGIYESDDGVWRFKCQACGAGGDIYDVISLAENKPLTQVAKETGDIQPAKQLKSTAGQKGLTFPTIEAAQAYLEKRTGSIETIYKYLDETGELFEYVFRLQVGNDKTFRPLRPLPDDGYELKAQPAPRKLYHLPEVVTADTVFICEGEKSCDALTEAMGYIATTSPGGSKNARSCDWGPLAGKTVYLWEDDDEPGKKYADDVIAELAELEPEPTVYQIDVDGLAFPERDKGFDAADFVNMHGDDSYDKIGIAVNNAKTVEFPEKKKLQDQPGSTNEAEVIAEYQPFPTDVLPDSIKAYVAETAQAICCDESFVALPALAVMASAIGNTRQIQLKGSWTEPSIVWAAVVAESGTMKSPSWEAACRPAQEAHAERYHNYEQAKELYEQTGDQDSDVEPPKYEPLLVSDVTIEALINRLGNSDRGLLVAREELAGWFRSFGQYKNGKGGDEAHWLAMHGGRSLQMDRKKDNEVVFISKASVSVTGTIQPGVLQKCLTSESYESGLAARVLLTMPPRRPKRWTEAEISKATQQRYVDTYDGLLDLEFTVNCRGEPTPWTVPLSGNAKSLWMDFVNEWGQETVELSGALAAVAAKLEGYAARFALVFYCIKQVELGDDAKGPIDAESIEAGIKLARWFDNESRRICGMLGEARMDREQDRLVKYIEGKGGSVTPGDLRYLTPRRTAAQWKAQLDELAKGGFGNWKSDKSGPQGGRPSMVFYLCDR